LKLSWNLSLKEEEVKEKGLKEEEFKGGRSLKEEGVIIIKGGGGGGKGGKEVRGQLNASF
jgi:hypothetical protein